MNLTELQGHWHALGERDPLWAILSDPAKVNGGWDPEEFFCTGTAAVADLMEQAGRLGLPRRRRRALDFGCGAGRLTQALAEHFDRCVGVDVAPSMVDLARSHNRHGRRCAYRLNPDVDLGQFPDDRFDLVYSLIVLQHVGPDLAGRYVAEF